MTQLGWRTAHMVMRRGHKLKEVTNDLDDLGYISNNCVHFADIADADLSRAMRYLLALPDKKQKT